MASPSTVPELTSDPEVTEKIVWKSFATDISHLFSDYMKGGSMVDTTLIAGGEKIRVHRMVLSATSSFLKKILTEVDVAEPCIILPDEVSIDDLKLLVDFMYRGEIRFMMSQLVSLSKLAQMLGIPGLPGFTEAVFAQNVGNEKYDDKVPWIEEEAAENDFDDSSDPLNINSDSNSTDTQAKLVTEKAAKKAESKKHNSASLEEGFKLLQNQYSISEASKMSGVPRTTLYTKARSCGVIHAKEATKKYTAEQVDQAIKAVADGQSLKTAADMYGLSKTALWRKSQVLKKNSKMTKKQVNYSIEQKMAAIHALKTGAKTRKVALEYGIPAGTLYREKLKLLESGVLPKDSFKRKTLDDILDRQFRVQQAVAACKEGKMTQSSAATHFEVPKTTIWRRLRSSSLNPVPQVPEQEKVDLTSTISIAPSNAPKENETDFTTFVIDGTNLKFVSEDDAMSMGSSHYIVLSGNEADSLPGNLQVMLPQNEGGVVCEVEELAHVVDMETECVVEDSEDSK